MAGCLLRAEAGAEGPWEGNDDDDEHCSGSRAELPARRLGAAAAGVAVCLGLVACFAVPRHHRHGLARLGSSRATELVQDLGLQDPRWTDVADDVGGGGGTEYSLGDVYEPAVGPTLFCFSLVMPGGKEFDLMQMLLQRGMGPFSCDGHNIYSNSSLALGTNPATGFTLMTTSIGEGPMECEYQSRWATALNTALFMRVWAKVSAEGQYLNYDWSVKLDADCVFLPHRLRSILIGIDPFMPAFLENCKYGLHGPLEVVNRLGMRAFFLGEPECSDIYDLAVTKQPMMFDKTLHDHLPPFGGIWVADTLEHGFGEDEYLRKCLVKLSVKKIHAHGMLAEEACKTARPCSDRQVVAFHPYKDKDSYMECVRQTRA